MTREVRPTPSAAAPPASGFLLGAAAAAMFAWLGPLSRWAYEGGMEPVGFIAWRSGFGAAALVVAIVLARRAVAARRAVPNRERRLLGLAALMALLLNLAMFAAFERSSVAIVLIGFYTYPAMVALVAVLFGRERLTGTVLAALALATAGMVVVVLGGVDPERGLAIDQVGFGLALGAAACQTVFVTIGRDGYGSVPSERATAIILGVTLVGAVVLALVGLAPSIALPVSTPDLLLLVVLAGVAGAGIPSLLFLTAIRRIGGTRAGIVMLLEPVAGAALAAVLLGETLQPVQLLGGAAVLAAAALLQLATGGRPEIEPRLA